MASSTKETQQPSLQDRLADAKQKAATARAHLDSLTSRLHQAVQAERYGDADALQAALPEAERSWAFCQADVKAIEGTLEHLAREQAARDAEIAAEKRRQKARADLERATAEERALTDDLLAVRSEIIAGLGAVRDAVARGKALEAEVKRKRDAQQEALVTAGQQDTKAAVNMPNDVTALVDANPGLLALVRDYPLVGV